MNKLDWKIVELTLLPVVVVTLSLVYYKSMITAFLSYHVFICLFLPCLWYFFSSEKKGKGTALLGLRFVKMKQSVFVGISLGVLSFLTIVVFFSLLQGSIFSKEHIQSLLAAWGYKKEFFPLLFVYFIFFNAIVEEIFWRGFLFSHYNKSFGALIASLIISLCFIQYHFITIWLLFSLQVALLLVLALFFASLVWCYFRVKYGNIYPSIINHFFADLAIMYVYYVFVF